MVNYSRPGVTGKMIEAAANTRAFINYVGNASFRRKQTGELPLPTEIDYFLRLAAKSDPQPRDAERFARLLARVHQWAADPALSSKLPPGPYLLQPEQEG